LETGYAKTIEKIVSSLEFGVGRSEKNSINIIAGSHLTPADVGELREIVEAFGMKAVILPDLSALDGSRQIFSPLASGGTTMEELASLPDASYTVALGMSMEPAAKLLQQKFGIAYRMFDGISGLSDSDRLMQFLAEVSGQPVPRRYERQRRILVDTMRDAHALFGSKKICIALEPDLAVQTSKWLDEMGAIVQLAVVPTLSEAADRIHAREVRIGDLFSITGDFYVLISNSHAESTARLLGTPLYEMGFPVYKTFGYTSKVTIGYRGTVTMVNDVANLLMKKH
jgi:nitrogenase molybdenum-iron protein alpha/beta subunit